MTVVSGHDSTVMDVYSGSGTAVVVAGVAVLLVFLSIV
jgi:hypothetical protein